MGFTALPQPLIALRMIHWSYSEMTIEKSNGFTTSHENRGRGVNTYLEHHLRIVVSAIPIFYSENRRPDRECRGAWSPE